MTAGVVLHARGHERSPYICLQAQNGATAMHNAAGGGFEAVVKALLAANADLDVQNTNCNTALHLAAGKGLPSTHPSPCMVSGILTGNALQQATLQGVQIV